MVQRSRARGRLAAVVAMLFCFLTVGTADAMKVSPMVSELTTVGAGSSARIEVGNFGGSALPFETLITELVVGPDGEMIEQPADDVFLVFPPQGIVPTNGRQVVRVQWIGDPDIKTSRAFYLWVRQLPVATTPESEGQGSLQVSVLYTMKALIVVAPPGAEPTVSVVSAVPAMVRPPAAQIDPSLTGGQVDEPAAQPGLEITVENSGTRYALMSGASWNITGTDINGQPYQKVMSSDTVSEVVGVGYLAPGGARRTFKVPTDGVELDTTKPVAVRFSR